MIVRKHHFANRASISALVAVVVALSAVGCGDEDDPVSGDPFAEGDAALSVTLDPDGPDGPGDELIEEVSCEETSDDAPCEAIADLDADAFDPPSEAQACTELYGGPDVATLKGQIDGEELDVELTRENGCEIERFDAAVPLLQALFGDYEPGKAIDEPVAG